MPKTNSSRQIIRDRAKALGWKRLPSQFPLIDRWGKNGRTLGVAFSIVGNVVRGSVFEPTEGWQESCNNRKTILKVLGA